MTIAMDHLVTRKRVDVIVSMAVSRAWKDSEYRRDLVTRPKEVLAEEGFDCPDGVDLEILQDTPTAKYVILPPDTADTTTAVSLVEQALQMEAGRELRLMQSSDTKWYVVLPQAPTNLQADEIPGLVLSSDAAPEDGGWLFTTASAAVTSFIGVA